MIETHQAWFNPNLYAWIPGTVLGILGGVEGTLAGIMAPRGKGKGLVLGVHFGCMVLCMGLLITGLIALAAGQPYGIWYGFGFPGLLGLVIFGCLTPLLFRGYREADMRKSLAKDL